MEEHAAQEKSNKRRSFRRILLLLLLTAAAAAFVVWSPLFALKQITIHGSSYISEPEVCRIAGVYRGERLYAVRESEIRQRLLNDLRIETAEVHHIFPGSLDITITERVPMVTIACEYGYLDLDREGMVIDAYRTLKNMKIPMVTGLTMHDLYIGDTVQNASLTNVLYYLQQLDSASRNQLSEINIASPGHAVAYTNSSVQIRIGDLDRLDEKASLTQDFLKELQTIRLNISI